MFNALGKRFKKKGKEDGGDAAAKAKDERKKDEKKKEVKEAKDPNKAPSAGTGEKKASSHEKKSASGHEKKSHSSHEKKSHSSHEKTGEKKKASEKKQAAAPSGDKKASETKPKKVDSSITKEQQIEQHAKAAKKAKDRQAITAKPINFDDESYKTPSYPKSKDDSKFLQEALSKNFIFSDFTDKETKMLINAMQLQEAKEGDIIIQQGDVGEFFYVVETGSISFIVDEKHVGNCAGGGSFGELALLYDAPRAATCMAETDAKLWKVDQTTFRHLLARQSKDQQNDISKLVSKIPLLRDMDKVTVNKFASVLTPVKFAQGELIVKKGDEGNIFYIINDGQVKVHDIGVGDAQIADQILKPGDWFGERALMTGEPRAANVTAMTDVVASAVDRETFETTIGSLEKILGHESKKRFVKSVPIFAKSKLQDIEFDRLVKSMTEEKFEKGQKVPGFGTDAENKDARLMIVKEGSFNVTGKDRKYAVGSGGYFGDKEVRGQGTDKGCVAEEASVCWVLTRNDIERIIGDVKKLGEVVAHKPKVKKDVKLADLKKHRMLGMGAFGKVWLVSVSKHKKADSPEDAYALKTINKLQVLRANQVDGVVREKTIMASIDHPFVLGLVAHFSDDMNVYLLLPLIQGGELFNVIHTRKRDGVSNEKAVFYGACILEALGHLHDRNIVYRDMKPENALIDAKGYCIMVDLGFAKVVVDKTYTLCGTPEYLAPEIIMSKGHNKAVDYWSFGVLVYEMLVGKSPFYFSGCDQMSLFKRIVKVKYTYPTNVAVSEDAKDLIKLLLQRRQQSRLGNLSRGHLDVREHQWFRDVDFQKLCKKKLEAPWLPKIKNPLDTSYFEDFSKEEKEKETGRKLTDKEQKLFEAFH